ncbi:DUF4199 domain-containing protein [Winogradskyella maritima]|uniref:DUF4199 domain-containing protein n=1 Tax=Winogradskyella maritima TaxID=1517766 RepID=A0ABV8AL48_9FLAO|nr:DUF4199 domain-containing protein [Winogradskyella maritima]
MEKSIKSSALNYGLYLGLTLCAITIVCYAVNMELLVNFWVAILLPTIIAITFGVISTAKSKSLLGGYISFKQAFSSFFITIAIGILISSVVLFVLFNFIDPESAVMLKEMGLEKSREMMEGFGMAEAQINEAMAKAEQQDSFSITTQALGYAQALVFYSIIGLIVALIMKRKDPNAE